MKPLRIGIIGGSMAGLFAGSLLQRDGHDVTIFERSSVGLGGRGAGLVPQQEVYSFLERVGLEYAARVGVSAFERVYLDRYGNVAETVSTPQTQISWDYLYNSVASLIDDDRYILNSNAVSVADSAEGAEIYFGDGSSINADLVIGADGLGSIVRKSLFPHHFENSYAGYVAWRGLLKENDVPPDASLLLERFSFYVTKGNHALGYLVPGPNGEMDPGRRRYNWVWYRKVQQVDLVATFSDKDDAHHKFSLPRGGLSTERRDALRLSAAENLPPQFVEVVRAENEPSIQGIFDYDAPSMIGRSVALIGDAAYVARPHTAMGVSKAAGDAMTLADALRDSDNLSNALRLFSRTREPVGRDIVNFGRRLGATSI